MKLIRRKPVEILLEQNPLQLTVIRPLGIEKRCRAIQDQPQFDIRRSLQQYPHGIAGNITVGSSGQLDAVTIPADIDPQFAQGDLGKLDNTG